MSEIRVGVVGAGGYSGAVLARLVAAHPSFRLAFCTSQKHVGESVADHLGMHLGTGVEGDLRFEPNSAALEIADRADAIVLATPAETSAQLAPMFVERGRRVVDLSGAFRLESSAAYTKWYGFTHPAPALLDPARVHYGLPELFGVPPKDVAIVANPGCYPTAALLALAPLLRAKLIESNGIIIDAKSGVTGAGRQSKEEFSFAEVDQDLRAYKLLSHQHTPEIDRGLTRFVESNPAHVTFTAHLLPVKRGLFATCYARPRAGATAARVAECLADTYAKRAFVEAETPERVTLASVVGTNRARVGGTANDDVVIVTSVIDNLLKGAAGQAVQNLNLLYGLDEATGLAHLHRMSA